MCSISKHQIQIHPEIYREGAAGTFIVTDMHCSSNCPNLFPDLSLTFDRIRADGSVVLYNARADSLTSNGDQIVLNDDDAQHKWATYIQTAHNHYTFQGLEVVTLRDIQYLVFQVTKCPKDDKSVSVLRLGEPFYISSYGSGMSRYHLEFKLSAGLEIFAHTVGDSGCKPGMADCGSIRYDIVRSTDRGLQTVEEWKVWVGMGSDERGKRELGNVKRYLIV